MMKLFCSRSCQKLGTGYFQVSIPSCRVSIPFPYAKTWFNRVLQCFAMYSFKIVSSLNWWNTKNIHFTVNSYVVCKLLSYFIYLSPKEAIFKMILITYFQMFPRLKCILSSNAQRNFMMRSVLFLVFTSHLNIFRLWTIFGMRMHPKDVTRVVGKRVQNTFEKYVHPISFLRFINDEGKENSFLYVCKFIIKFSKWIYLWLSFILFTESCFVSIYTPLNTANFFRR